MRKNVTNVDYAGDVQTKRFQLPANPADEHMDALAQQLGKFYKSRKVLSRTTLSHLVSCRECLDKANRLLELPPLTDRNVIDVLGRTNDAESKVSYPLMRLLSLLSASPILAFLSSAATDCFDVMC